MARQCPIEVTELWDGRVVFCRGAWGGLPVFAWRGRPGSVPSGLATVRQLRGMGLRPGGQDQVGVLMFAHRKPYRRREFAALYRIDLAKPRRPVSPAQLAALGQAMAARRRCTTCGRDAGYCVPTSTRQCWTCFLPADTDRTDPTTSRPRPGGHPAKNAHQAGFPSTAIRSEETHDATSADLRERPL